MALKRVWIGSPNYTGGNYGRRLLVIHSSEGAQSYQDLGNFFANSSSQVSSHTGIDNKVRGTIGEYVKRGNSSWTASNANMVSVQTELCTPSGASNNWSRDTWLSKDTMLRNLADWLQEESNATGIPLKLLNNSQAQGTGRGVCEHKNLGAWGGGHVDCGPNFPIDYVMDLATGGTGSTPESGFESMAIIQLNKGEGAITVVAIPPGAKKFRSASNNDAFLRCDFIPSNAETDTMTPRYDNVPEWKIPDGARAIIVHREDGGSNNVCMSFGV